MFLKHFGKELNINEYWRIRMLESIGAWGNNLCKISDSDYLKI